MEIEEIILNTLLDKYEKSKSYTANVNRRIIVKMSQIKKYKIEDYEQKELWNSVLIDLQKQNFIGLSWEKFEVNNIAKEVWLIKESIPKIYKKLDRRNPKESYQKIVEQLEEINFTQEWIAKFQSDMKQEMRAKQKENTLLPLERSNEIIRALKEIDNIQNEGKNTMVLKRVFSIKCYNDSKYFERNIEKYIVKIVRKYLHLEELTESEILAEVGIVKYSEVIEFCGNIKCHIQGQIIEYASITKGSYINGNTINDTKKIEISNDVTKIIFIENKANYMEYIQNKTDNELVIYHGGFYSPIKGEFFRKIYQSSEKRNVEFYHWSDIDIGGFEIFTRLRDNIIPELKPINMDIVTLQKYRNKAITIEDSYHKKLAKLKENKRFEVFWNVIDYMLQNNIKLEQEAIIE